MVQSVDVVRARLVIRLIPGMYSTRHASGTRDEIVADALELSARISKSVCAVFGPGDSVFVEPDGRQVPSTKTPDGFTYLLVDAHDDEEPDEVEPADVRLPSWRVAFGRSRLGAGIWAVHNPAFGFLVDELDRRGVPEVDDWEHAVSWWAVDRWARAFLDGGLYASEVDGFKPHHLRGQWLIGARCMAWACAFLELTPPRSLAGVDRAEIEAELDAEPRSRGATEERGELLAKARSGDDLTRAAEVLALPA